MSDRQSFAEEEQQPGGRRPTSSQWEWAWLNCFNLAPSEKQQRHTLAGTPLGGESDSLAAILCNSVPTGGVSLAGVSLFKSGGEQPERSDRQGLGCAEKATKRLTASGPSESATHKERPASAHGRPCCKLQQCMQATHCGPQFASHKQATEAGRLNGTLVASPSATCCPPQQRATVCLIYLEE